MDESGDLGSIRGSKFFVIAGLVTQNRRELEHCIKRVRQRSIGKNKPVELKAYDATDRTRNALLRCVAKQDIRIYAVVVNKLAVADQLGSGMHTLYNHLACTVVGRCLEDARVRCLMIDKYGDKIVRDNFDRFVRALHGDIEIEHPDSRDNKLIQVVDFIAWSIRRKYASDDERFYSLIANKIKCEEFWKGA